MTRKKQLHLPLLIILLASLVFGILPLGQLSQVYANPDTESLWSGSNSVSTAQLTLTNSANADGSGTGTWADASGLWAKATYEYWTFVMGDSAVGTGTINSVTLYLKHYQSGWSNDNYNIDVYDGSTWNTVLSYTSGSGPPTTDTTDSWVVSTALNTWTKIDAAQVRIIGNGPSAGEDTVDWFVDTVELRVDYTPPVPPDISNTPTSFGFGTLAEGATVETTGGLTTAYFTVTNNSSYAVNITIGGTDMTGGTTWTLSNDGTAGNMICGLKAGLEGGSYSVIVRRDAAYNTLITNLAASGTQDWALQLLAPTTFTDGGAKSGIVTLTATQS